VRFCSEVAGTEELYIKERGHEATITTFPGKQLENPYSGNVVDVCPVGALLNREFRFQSRVWWLKQADSVCSFCARGCNVRLDHHWNKVQRIVPRTNLEVNRYWMCDRGRMNHKWFNEQRLVEARVAGRDVTLREALDALGERLRGGAGTTAVLLSPKLANEELLVLRRLFADALPVARLGGGSLEPDQPEDAILRRADPHPNSWALRVLGLAADPRQILGDTTARGLILFGDDPVGWEPALADALRRFEWVAMASTHTNATTTAVDQAGGILLPLATHAEFAGSFTNFEGRVQRFEPALAPLGSAMSGYDLGIEIAHTVGAALWPRAERNALLVQAIWEELLPAGVPLAAPAWAAVPEDRLVPAARKTAQAQTRGYTPTGKV
jgi:NADH-quinone oxidoreductase subunit G